MGKEDQRKTGAEPDDRIVREEGTTDQRRKSLAERWVWSVWWSGIKSERLRCPESFSAILLCLVAWHGVTCLRGSKSSVFLMM